MKYRIEHDTLGEVKVPTNALWGAQTERSRNHFKIGPVASMPFEIIKAFAVLKKAVAFANCDLGVLSSQKRDLISEVCQEIIEGKLNEHFPLVIWQTGSGTQTNMNLNEVIANRAQLLQGGKIGENPILHPNDDVNKSQSSNDTFPTAMHMACYQQILEKLLPAVEQLHNTFNQKAKDFKGIIKIGRTHLMDATPLTLGQEFSGYTAQLEFGIKALKNTLPHLSQLAIGGTAVGTGLNAPKGFDVKATEYISQFTGISFVPAKNKFEALAAHDALVESHGAIKQLAVALYKIAQDIRFLASGPRNGLGELLLPENEPGSSIMPGKVNPTQNEALTMVCAQIIGNDATITFAGTQGNFQLNTFKPVMAYNFLQSVELLADACISFDEHCAKGIEANEKRIQELLHQSLMLVTALNPHIGYEKAAKIAKSAHQNGTKLKEEALKSGWVTEEQFEEWVNPTKMI